MDFVTQEPPISSSSTSSKRLYGYNIDLFIDNDSACKYLCSICHHVVNDCHETTNCGHIFCGGCIRRALMSKEGKFRCPACNTSNSSLPRLSIYLNRAVYNLQVKCPFRQSGCDWVGSLNDLVVRTKSTNTNNNTNINNDEVDTENSSLGQQKNNLHDNNLTSNIENNSDLMNTNNNNRQSVDSFSVNEKRSSSNINQNTIGHSSNKIHKVGHLTTCKFASVTCEQCGAHIIRKEMESHVKKCLNSCPHCNMEFISGIDRNAHFSLCPSTSLCPHCKQQIKRDQLKHHTQVECLEKIVKCPFSHLGCPETIKKQFLNQHLKYNATTHNQLKIDYALEKIEKLKSQLECLHEYKTKSETLETAYDELKKQNLTIVKQCDDMKREYHNLKKEFSELKKTTTGQLDTLQSPPPEVLVLCGSNKWEESGTFIKRSRLHQGRVCYTCIRSKCAIRWNPHLTAWLIDRRGLALDNEASLIAYQDVPHPGLVSCNWLVYNDDYGKWISSENYLVEFYNLAEFLFEVDNIFSASIISKRGTGTSSRSTISIAKNKNHNNV